MAESTSLASRLMKLVARVVISPSSWKESGVSAGAGEGGGAGLRGLVSASRGWTALCHCNPVRPEKIDALPLVSGRKGMT